MDGERKISSDRPRASCPYVHASHAQNIPSEVEIGRRHRRCSGLHTNFKQAKFIEVRCASLGNAQSLRCLLSVGTLQQAKVHSLHELNKTLQLASPCGNTTSAHLSRKIQSTQHFAVLRMCLHCAAAPASPSLPLLKESTARRMPLTSPPGAARRDTLRCRLWVRLDGTLLDPASSRPKKALSSQLDLRPPQHHPTKPCLLCHAPAM